MEKETALKILRERHNQALFSERTALETLIPELKKSDEQIRKEIIQFVYEQRPEDDWLAWLEKQDETYTKKDVDDAYLKGICDAKRELENTNSQK